jgi:hypothetical protein
MKYWLVIYSEEQAPSETVREHCYVESARFAHELQRAVAV